MSGKSAKQRKTTDTALAGVTAIASLPPELLDTVFGFLDVGTLCTARLVCAHFCSEASRRIHSIKLSVETLRSRPETNLNNFPNLSQVTVCDVKRDDLPMLAQSPVADAVTHLLADAYFWPMARCTQNAVGLPRLPLPNLTSLTVYDAIDYVFSFPQALRELNLGAAVTDRTATMLADLTHITCLRVDIRDMRKPFEAVTALTALRMLEIWGELSVVPFVAELTLLTNLYFEGECGETPDSDLSSLASLSRLRGLLHLGFSALTWDSHFSASLEGQLLSSMATFTGLRSLDLGVCKGPVRSAFETVCMAPFCELTALKLEGIQLGASFLPRFNLERLQALSLPWGVKLDRRGVAALRRATGLTHLGLGSVMMGGAEGYKELGKALPRMSQLRSLSLFTCNGHPTFSLKVIALLTELTRLKVRGVTSYADVEVCLGLKKLHVLHIEGALTFRYPPPFDRITHEMFFALAKLPELRKLTIMGPGGKLRGDLIDNFLARLNAERLDKGWLPLELNIAASY